MVRSDEDLWKVYGNKIKDAFLQGQPVDKNSRIYLPPLNSCAIPAGSKIAAPITNFGVQRAGDALISVDNPFFSSTGDGYAQRCLNYLEQVQLDADASTGLIQARDIKYDAMNKSSKAFQDMTVEARGYYNSSGGLAETGMGFEEWAQMNYPSWQAAKDQSLSDKADYDNILSQISGVGFKAWVQAKQRLEAALQATPSKYNMAVLSALLGSASDESKEERRPKYNIDPAYPTVIQEWIMKSATSTTTRTTISFSSKEMDKYKWDSLGYSNTTVEAKADFACFFSINYNYNNTQQKAEVSVKDSSSSIDVEISAMGIQAFSINPDSSWNPGNIKETYPKLMPKAPAALWKPLVQVTNVVVGYNVSVKITLDSKTFNQIEEHISKAKKQGSNVSGSIFGFRFSGGGSSEEKLNTDLSEIKTTSGGNTITFPGSNNTVPVLLAVIGKVTGQ